MPPIVQVQNLVKTYKNAKTNAVDDVSFSVPEGSFFALLGPNGAGKTTTISILTTTLNKTSGTIKIAGYDLDKEESSVRKNIGVIFQQPSLDLNLTAEENIRLHSVMYGLYGYRPLFSMMPQEYKKKVHELADVLQIRGELFQPIKSFSGGMKRKLEIIRSLIHNPKVLFLDEPTSGLDPVSRKSLWDYLAEVRKTYNTTVFLTTHYLEEAEDADEVCILINGKIKEYGTPTHIKKQLVEEFIMLDSKTREPLLKELTKKKFKFNDMGESGIKVHLNKKTAHEIIKSIDTPLSMLRIHTPTLEEAYVEVVEREESKKS